MPKKKDVEFEEEPERKEPPVRKEHKYLRYDFSDAEMLQMGKELARVNERIGALEKDKEEVVSAIKAKISRSEGEGSHLSLCLNKGYEMRDIECVIEYHKPINGRKTITRTDTGEVVEETYMDSHEMQEQLPLESEAVTS